MFVTADLTLCLYGGNFGTSAYQNETFALLLVRAVLLPAAEAGEWPALRWYRMVPVLLQWRPTDRHCPVIAETATSEVVIMSIGVRYFQIPQIFYVKKPYANNMRVLLILIETIPSLAATAFLRLG